MLWVAMERWFLCKKFLVWLAFQDFDWVTKAKRNTVLFRKIYDHGQRKVIYVKAVQKGISQSTGKLFCVKHLVLLKFCKKNNASQIYDLMR